MYESFLGTETGGPAEGTKEHSTLEQEMGFSYRTLLGEMMYAYVSCRLDVAYAITTLSKFTTRPTKLHYQYLKGLLGYLNRTKSWGIRYHRTCDPSSFLPDLPDGDFSSQPTPLPSEFSKFPSSNPSELTYYVDAAYANDLRQRRSTTGYAITMAGGSIAYRSKTQSVTALSSTEAEFFAAVSASKDILYLRSVLSDLHFPLSNPTPLYEDNEACIKVIKSRHPTERTRHIDTPAFCIQHWFRQGDVKPIHIPGILNPADANSKPLGWVLHSRHSRRMMGHYQ